MGREVLHVWRGNAHRFAGPLLRSTHAESRFRRKCVQRGHPGAILDAPICRKLIQALYISAFEQKTSLFRQRMFVGQCSRDDCDKAL